MLRHTDHRWQRSIYLDTEPRDIIVRFSEMIQIGQSGAFDPAVADTLLFVVERVWVGHPPRTSYMYSDEAAEFE